MGTRLAVHLPECPNKDSLPYEANKEQPEIEPVGVDSFNVVYRCPACMEQLGPAMQDVNLALDTAIAQQPLTPPVDPPGVGLSALERAAFGSTSEREIWRVNDDR